jgi:hypothetical protein
MKNKLPHIVTTTFIVSGTDLNARNVLDLCKILSVTTKHTDEAIETLTGELDFTRLMWTITIWTLLAKPSFMML